jgi:hypothetical protein
MPACAASPYADPLGIDTPNGRVRSDEPHCAAYVAHDLEHIEVRAAAVSHREYRVALLHQTLVAVRRKNAFGLVDFCCGQQLNRPGRKFSKLFDRVPTRTPAAAHDRDDGCTVRPRGAIDVEGQGHSNLVTVDDIGRDGFAAQLLRRALRRSHSRGQQQHANQCQPMTAHVLFSSIQRGNPWTSILIL